MSLMNAVALVSQSNVCACHACRHTACVLGRGLSLPFPVEVVSIAHHRIIAAVLGSNGSFPSLQDLELNFTKLSGPLPAEWGSPTGFQKLQTLLIYSCNINSKLHDLSSLLRMCTSFGKTQTVIQGQRRYLLAQASDLDICGSHSKWTAMADIKCLQAHCQPAGATQELFPCCQI